MTAPVALNELWLAARPLPSFDGANSKNSRGTVLLIGGSPVAPSALLLTAEAGFRAGAGKVQLAVAAAMVPHLAALLPEGGFAALPVDAAGELDGASLEGLPLDRADAIVVGCGTAQCGATGGLLTRLLERAPADVPILIDAGACVCAADAAEAIRARAGRIVLTPHPGEMARLLGREEAAVDADPAGAVDEAIGRFDAIVALRGAETWIGAPDGTRLRYPGGGVGLAVAGSGDVGVGAIGGLLARGADPLVAAAWGVWAHGQAGRAKGAPGFLARELLPLLPGLLML